MTYEVIAVPDSDTVHIWDGMSKRYNNPVPIELTIPNHGFGVGDKVSLVLRKKEEQEQ